MIGVDEILVGRSDSHVVPWRESGARVHLNVVAALEAMALAAEGEGILLRLHSGFRGFERQLAIWNAKATGKRALLDDHGVPLDFSKLSSEQVIAAILRWSALPGSSRHHWGTDMDVYDGSALDAGYEVQLTVEESYSRFARLHAWLDVNMQRFGFFRPYSKDLGGIAPEPWHLSFAPLSETYFAAYRLSLLEETVRGCEMVLKSQVLENLPQIFERYFLRISRP